MGRARMARRSAARVLAAGALLISAVATGGPQEGGERLFFDTVDVHVVNVEVVVTDRQGEPVTGLTRDDFELFEDGRPVELTNFLAVEGREAVRAAAGAAEPELAELAFTPQTRRLNLVVFIDNFNMRPENRNLIFDELTSYLRDRLDPRDRVMLVTMGERVEIAQPFTNDVLALLETLERLSREVGPFVRVHTQQQRLLSDIQRAVLSASPTGAVAVETANANFDAAQSTATRLAASVEQLAEVRYGRVAATVEALERFTESLAGIKGRKAILYVSDGLPLRTADSLAQAWLNKFESWIQNTDAADARNALFDMSSMVNASRFDASDRFRDLVDYASSHGVVFYPLSNAGRLGRSQISAEFEGSGTVSGRGAVSSDVVALETISLESSLLQMAEGTGGIAFTRTTNADGLLERMVRDFDTFYSLGYTPDRERDDQSHEVEVRVKRDGLVVRHLGAYRERDPMDRLRDLTLSALHHGLVDNPLDVRLAPAEPERKRGKVYQLSVMVQIPFQRLLLMPQDEHHVAQVTLLVVARDERKGGVSPTRRIDLPIKVPNGQVAQVLEQAAAYPLQLELEAGPKRIAVGVRDHLAQIDATVNLDLIVGEGGADSAPAAGG